MAAQKIYLTMNRAMNSNHKQYKALLIDLDGTLLDIDLDSFMFDYVDALSQRFAGYLDRDDFVRHLFASTRVTVENTDPSMKNEVVFYEEFCRRIGYSHDQIRPLIDDFYRREFARLSCWGREHPYSGAVIAAAKRKNLALILATNPIFPAAATLQRLAWAGLSANDFQLITTMENMHFCKPKKEYYLEIADRIGFNPHQCLMAGNDTLEDLIASETGMETFLVEDFILQRGNAEPSCNYRGNLSELAAFVEELKQ